jgi:hypothetical protein
MATLNAESTLVASPKAVWCEVAGETVILDTASDRYFALSATGTEVWNALQTPCTLASLCDRLVSEYQVSAEQCLADVSALLDQLVGNGLVMIDQCTRT